MNILMPAATASNAVAKATNLASIPLSIKSGILWIAIVPNARLIKLNIISNFQNSMVFIDSLTFHEISTSLLSFCKSFFSPSGSRPISSGSLLKNNIDIGIINIIEIIIKNILV